MTGIAFLLLDYNSVMACWKGAGFAIFRINALFAIISLVKIYAFGRKKKAEKSD